MMIPEEFIPQYNIGLNLDKDARTPNLVESTEHI